jgi:hypothetical protein
MSPVKLYPIVPTLFNAAFSSEGCCFKFGVEAEESIVNESLVLKTQTTEKVRLDLNR